MSPESVVGLYTVDRELRKEDHSRPMHFPKFWARGSSGQVSCWRWSDESAADAHALALAQATKIASALSKNQTALQRYGYADRPLREEVLEQTHTPNGTVSAAITRNSYGCLVLNTSRAMFLDVDVAAKTRGSPLGLAGFLRRIFCARPPSPPHSAMQEIQSSIEGWVRLNPTWGMKLYQTAAGFRVFITHELFDPARVRSEAICNTLKVDPLYSKLCETQQSFRARLTPKPWRIDLEACPVRWPWESVAREEQFRRWERDYAARCEEFATCKFCGNFGSSEIHPEIVELVKSHDRICKAHSGLPLA